MSRSRSRRTTSSPSAPFPHAGGGSSKRADRVAIPISVPVAPPGRHSLDRRQERCQVGLVGQEGLDTLDVEPAPVEAGRAGGGQMSANLREGQWDAHSGWPSGHLGPAIPSGLRHRPAVILVVLAFLGHVMDVLDAGQRTPGGPASRVPPRGGPRLAPPRAVPCGGSTGGGRPPARSRPTRIRGTPGRASCLPPSSRKGSKSPQPIGRQSNRSRGEAQGPPARLEPSRPGSGPGRLPGDPSAPEQFRDLRSAARAVKLKGAW